MCNLDNFRWVSKNLTINEIKDKKILDVGSYDVNGSLRYVIEMLEPKEYIGTDIVKGPGVDVVCSADKLAGKFGKNSFDVVISTSALEHIRDWQTAISSIKQVCKPGGLIIISMPSRWPFHEYPYDFWRYGKTDIKKIFEDCEILILEKDASRMSQVYAKIKKPKNFKEIDLSAYELYSVAVNKRIPRLDDRHLKGFRFKRLTVKGKIWSFLHIKGNRLLAYGNPCYPRKMDTVD